MLNPLEVIWEFISRRLENTEYEFAVVIGAATFCGAIGLFRRFKQWKYRVVIALMTVGMVFIEYCLLLKWNCILIYLLTGCLCILPPLWILVLFIKNQFSIGKIRKACEQRFYVDALKILDTIKIWQLTPRQLQKYQKRRFSILVNLGSLRKAKSYLEETRSEHDAFYHFSLHILAYFSGDLKTSFQEIQAAEDSTDLKKDPFLQFQVILNHGVCYAAEKNYHLADEYYRKAIAFYDDHKLRDEELLGTFYYNYAFNCLRLNPDSTEWEKALDTCQARLNMRKTAAKIRMLNLRLELLNQVEAPRETLNELLQEAFSTIVKDKLPLKNQVFFASSAARVAWAGQVNPLSCLKLLSDNLPIIDSLSASQRYHVYSELEILFRDLHGPANDSFENLRSRTSAYLIHDAEKDLHKWQESLPEEAIYERCDCLKKLAFFRRTQMPYNQNSVIGFQQNAIRLYHDNELYLDELRTHQDIMDELLDERNRDEDYRPIYADTLREHFQASEELLSNLTGHPALAETYLRLGCYCLDLDEYEKSISYMRLFEASDVSDQNFAPWLRRYHAILLLYTRIIMFDQAIKRAAADKRIRSMNKDVQDWFATYPQHDGGMEALLLGRFMSAPICKTRVWIPNGETEPQGHTWLWIPQIDLNIDLTYPQFTDDQLCECIFFCKNRHPFESGTSLTLQESQKSSALIFEGVICSQMENGLKAEAKMMEDAIYSFLSGFIPKDCPALEKTVQLLQEFMVPIPIQP